MTTQVYVDKGPFGPFFCVHDLAICQIFTVCEYLIADVRTSWSTIVSG
jgi:hypothetical protein